MSQEPRRETYGVTMAATDPTTLTGEFVRREIAHLDRLLTTRIDAVEQATQTANDTLTRVPTDVDKQVARLKELTEEKFRRVDGQFEQRDQSLEKQLLERDKSVDVALQAAKEAVAKQTEASDRAIAKAEAATTKEIDGVKAVYQTEITALREQIGALQQRIDRGEGVQGGAVATRKEGREGAAFLVSLAVAAVSFLGLIAVVISLIIASHP